MTEAPPLIDTAAEPTRAPGPTGLDAFRVMTKIRRDPCSAFQELVERYGNVVRIDASGQQFFLVNDPELVEAVFVGRQSNYGKTLNAKVAAMALGNGLLTNEGESWTRQRRIMQPLFARRQLDRFAEAMIDAAERTLARWATRPDGDRLDVSVAMNALTLDVTGPALFGGDLSDDAARVHEALVEILRCVGKAMTSLLTWLPLRIPGVTPDSALRLQAPRWRKLDAAVGVLDDVVARLIRERQDSRGDDRHDLLGLLLDARDEAGAAAMSPRQVRDELKTFLLVGHDTTAYSLAWTLLLLSNHPEARERLIDEVDTVLGDRRPTPADLDQLPWTSAVIEEAMRLYPPSWLIERQAVADDVLGGYHVPAGATVYVAPYLLHHDPRSWPNPEGFDPRRFLPEHRQFVFPAADTTANPLVRPRFSYLPFGAGHRQCIGLGFARIQAKLILAMLTQRYTFDLAAGARVLPEHTLTLRPRDGLPMVLRRRAPAADAGAPLG
ncbi:cytochrome P450 [Nocardia brasiliensis]|uniref:cytochrome P450 n=1 Tax=Nocardia brasiliensis TaxID=37326 RepID=UPI0018943876|nr:cytochrome P450 [Nocardia brasiliensis]MBF6542205.1 cytochrome P450 [Nocardia brasiliensis]